MTEPASATKPRSPAYVLAPGEARGGPAAWSGIKAGDADTAGLLSVFEDTLQPGRSGPPLHLHTHADEVLYVLEGSLVVRLGDEQREVTSGAFAWIPRGTPHAFANPSSTPTRLLGMATPAGLEALLAEQGAYFAQLEGAPDVGVLRSIGARHGSQLLGPPIEVAASDTDPWT